MGDKHIWSRPLYVTDRPEWPGLIVARRGRDFVVVDESDAAEGAPLKGAKLVSCDGVAADRLADERLAGFRVVRGIEAQLIQRSPWLLVEEGNPFLKRPQSCDFAQEGQVLTVPLKWRSLWRHDYFARLAAMPTRGAAGFGIRKVGEAYWIAVQSFSERAVPVVEAVRARVAELRAAPYVVLDLRGNSGGNSLFGHQIAQALLGDRFVDSVAGGEEGDACGKAWRVSERNLKQVEYYRDELGPNMGAEAAAGFKQEYDILAAAKAAGRPFTGQARCAPSAAKSGKKKPHVKPDYGGRVILLTDNACFSSCLMVTEEFRRLGALHVGQETDANTHYMEVREDKLPSGLSMFSTLQAMTPGSPLQMGPFTPTVLFEGNIADTPKLEAWIAGLASPERR